MSDSVISTCTLAKKRFDDFLYSEHKIDTDTFIAHIKSLDEDQRDGEMFSVLQSWVDWLVDSFDLSAGSVRQSFSGLNKYFRYHRIKITKEDIKEEIEYPESILEEKYAVSAEELQLIIPSLNWKNQGFCICLAGGGMRPQELMGTQKKHYSVINGKVKLEIPWYLTKKRISRTVFLTKEANKYVVPMLSKLIDDDFVWTKRKQIPQSIISKYSHLKSDKAWQKAVKKFALDMLVTVRTSFNRSLCRLNLDMKYEETNYSKINLYCFRGRFFTKALKVHGEDTAHAMIGHGAYLQQYQRRTDQEKKALFDELEPEILIDDSAIKEAQIAKLQKENAEKNRMQEKIVTLQAEQARDRKMLESLAKKLEKPDR